MTPVQSSNIAALDHDPITLNLTVQFRNGSFYEYSNVSVAKFDQMIKSDSIGSAFHKLIKSAPDQHPFRQLSTIIR